MFMRAVSSAVVVAGIAAASAHAQAPSADIAPGAPFVPPWPTDVSPVTIIPSPGYGFGAFEPGGGVGACSAFSGIVAHRYPEQHREKAMTVETEVIRHYTLSTVIVLGLALFGITAGSTARAAEIRLLSASALHPAIDALIPDFEKSSGHKVTVAYGTAGAVADRVQKGEAADIVISSVPMIDRLQAQGKVVAGDRVIIAKVGVGAFVRKGAAKPDISSADAFKRSMLAARSIAYPDPAGGGASGIYVASLLERLGIAAEMKPKTKLSTLETLYASVASGDVEIGFEPAFPG